VAHGLAGQPGRVEQAVDRDRGAHAHASKAWARSSRARFPEAPWANGRLPSAPALPRSASTTPRSGPSWGG